MESSIETSTTGTEAVAPTRADHAIFQDLCHRLELSDYLDPDEIQVCVAGGEIWLAGLCSQWEIKRMAGVMAASIPGAVAVHNHIQVDSENPALGSSHH